MIAILLILILILIVLIFGTLCFVFHALKEEEYNEETGKQLDIIEKELVHIKFIARDIER